MTRLDSYFFFYDAAATENYSPPPQDAPPMLAMGGVGLYLYKASNDDDSNDYEDNYVEHDQEGLFDRFWKGGDDDEDDDDDELSTISDDLSLSDDEESIEKPKIGRAHV